MQFIENGPQIPTELLDAHEQGNVIFFCGAGISCSAGLPNFKDLVNNIYKILHTDFTADEKEIFRLGHYDRVLDKLEKRIIGQRVAVRKALKKALTPKKTTKHLTQLHEALLYLSISKHHTIKLITTNFDLLFEKAIKNIKQSIPIVAAPNLPPLKKTMWNSLVYLHGKLPPTDNENEYNNLVLTSGDFGSAYLKDGWAAKFVSELFKNYHVCFIGYSLNDPVMRYMVDALGAEKRQGEQCNKIWAVVSYKEKKELIKKWLGSCEKAEQSAKIKEWQEKGVEPILYKELSAGKHELLNDTIKEWSNTYRVQINGKKSIIDREIKKDPRSAKKEDDFVGRVLWALSDASGNVMEYFVKKIKESSYRYAWFKALYEYDSPIADEKNWFHTSVTNIIQYFCRDKYDRNKHNRELQIIDWLLSFLSNIDFFIFILTEFYHKMSDDFKDNITFALANSQEPIAPRLAALWNYLIIDKIQQYSYLNTSLFLHHIKQAESDTLSAAASLELQYLLSPQIKIITTIYDDKFGSINYGLTTTADMSGIYILFPEIYLKLKKFLPQLFYGIQQNLLDALAMLDELNSITTKETDTQNPFSNLIIEPDPQDPFPNLLIEHKPLLLPKEWHVLIYLLRDSWIGIYQQDKQKASVLAQNCFCLPHIFFKKFALFAAKHENCIMPEQWLQWILSEDLLWNDITKHEILILIHEQSKKLSPRLLKQLEKAICHCPSSLEYREEEIYVRLKVLSDSISNKQTISINSKNTLAELQKKYPYWSITYDDEDGLLFNSQKPETHYCQEEGNIDNKELKQESIKSKIFQQWEKFWQTNFENETLANDCTDTILKYIEKEKCIPNEIEKILKTLCNTSTKACRTARNILMQHCQQLYTANKTWTINNLFPLLDWSNEEETKELWECLFLNHKINDFSNIEILLPFLKTSFIRYVKDNSLDSVYGKDCIQLLVMKLKNKFFTNTELRLMIKNFTQEQFVFFVQEIEEQYLKNDSSEKNFHQLLKPLWIYAVPKDNKYASKELTIALIFICLRFKKNFKQALKLFEDWLIPFSDNIIYKKEIKECLETKIKNPERESDERYRCIKKLFE